MNFYFSDIIKSAKGEVCITLKFHCVLNGNISQYSPLSGQVGEVMFVWNMLQRCTISV